MAGKAAAPKAKSDIGSMTDQMRAFVMEYTIDFNGYKAAVRAGYAEKSARTKASQLLAREDVQEAVQKRMERLDHSSEVKAERVIQETWGIATADVNDLVEFRRRCCRHCHGIEHGYQRTVREMSEEQARYNLARRRAEKAPNFDVDLYEPFDEKGGIGFDARRPPHPDCTNCWGDGIGDAFFKPTANLTPAARALYAGVKQTKEGYQMLTIDKLGALEKLYKHKGLYKVDNEQKASDLSEFLQAVQARGGKLPIKPQ